MISDLSTIRISYQRARSLVLIVAFALPSISAWQDARAHALGEDYVFTNIKDESIDGNIQIHLSDLREKLGLEIPKNMDKAGAAVEATSQRVHEYIRNNLSIGPESGKPYEFDFNATELLEANGGFAVYKFKMATGPLPDRLQIVHTMLYENDRFHRGLFLIDYNAKTGQAYGGEYTALVFSPTNTRQIIDLNDVPGLLEHREMIWQGMLHIWLGIDHVLFLLSLILPTVLFRQNEQWQSVDRFSRAFLNLLSIITVFTVAHSVSLLLAALDIVAVNSRFVESMIALSIVLVALNNVFVKVQRGALWIILFLGLFHGLGFASVLGNLPFRMVDLVKMVLLFNIGIELGQIVIVALVYPILFKCRSNPLYVPVFLKGGSMLLVVVASIWFFQRAFGLG